MTNQQILKKAIEKAVKNGYKAKFSERENSKVYLNSYKYFAILFSHSFAKTFWGKEKRKWRGKMGYDLDKGTAEKIKETIKNGWKYHLQQMVLEEEPLKYLEKYLNETI